MARSKKFYELSDVADEDISEIFDYTAMEFGYEQAVKYVSELEDLFNKLLDNPKMGRERGEIKPGLRSFPKSSHVVFYRLMKDRIRIVRVLHGSKDLKNFSP